MQSTSGDDWVVLQAFVLCSLAFVVMPQIFATMAGGWWVGLAFYLLLLLAALTSLVALIAPVGILGLINYYKENQVNLVAGGWIAFGFLGGAFLGSKIALNLDETMLRKGFAIFLVLVGIQMFFKS